MAFLQQGIMTDHEPTAIPQASSSESPSSFFTQRSRRQLGLFFAGAGFFAVTSLITRRSLVRRYKALVPKFYQPSNQVNEVNGAVEAFEALNIATINVMSVSMMMGGGLLYAFDISSLDEIREYVRRSIGLDGPRTDQDAEKEIEEWFARALSLGVRQEKPEEGPKGVEGVSEILSRLSKLEEEKKRSRPNDEEGK